GDQEVDIAVAGGGDRAAEHVGEEQHEHDRLHGEGEQQVGRADDAHEVALGEHHGVGDGTAKAAHHSPSASGSSAAWPVSLRKTSSRVGRRIAMSSIPTPAAFSRSTASAIIPLRSAIGTRSTTPSSSGGAEQT